MTPLALSYVAAVMLLAAVGFATGQALLVGIAALVTLPVGIAAVPMIYLMAGVMAFVPGANPSQASGSGYAGPHGHVVVTQTGQPASWYLVSIDVVGVVVLVLAAVANVLLLDLLVRRRRRVHAGA